MSSASQLLFGSIQGISPYQPVLSVLWPNIAVDFQTTSGNMNVSEASDTIDSLIAVQGATVSNIAGRNAGTFPSTNSGIIGQTYQSLDLTPEGTLEADKQQTFSTGSRDFTMDFWVYVPAGGFVGYARVFSCGEPGWGSTGVLTQRSGLVVGIDSNKLAYNAGYSNGPRSWRRTINTIPSGQWVFCRMIVENNIPFLSVNGIDEPTEAYAINTVGNTLIDCDMYAYPNILPILGSTQTYNLDGTKGISSSVNTEVAISQFRLFLDTVLAKDAYTPPETLYEVV